MSAKRSVNLKYIGYVVGIVAIAVLGVFTWWEQQNVLEHTAGVNQLAAFLYSIVGYIAVVLALSALGFRVRADLKYLGGIVCLTGFGAFAWYAAAYVAPQLGVFFGFVLAYVAAVIALVYILGHRGG